MAPSQISPLVVWLSSDLAKDVNGQVFAVSGTRIQVVQGFHPVTEIQSGGEHWTIGAIEARRKELLGGERGIPPFLPPLS